MRKRHCAGCGAAEPEGASPHKIRPVTITVSGEHGVRSWEQQDTHEEDLCESCTDRILTTFFDVRIDGDQSVPLPVSLRRVAVS